MWVKVAIAVVVLLWLSRRSEAAAPPPALAPPTGTIELGPSTVTFHEGSGVWDAPWVKPASSESSCYLEPDEFGGMRYVCP